MGLTATYRYSSGVAALQEYPKFMRDEMKSDWLNPFTKKYSPELRAEPYYAQRSTGNTTKWAVMRGPTIAEGVAAELTNGTLPTPEAVRGPLSHDRARSLARHLNKQHAEQQK